MLRPFFTLLASFAYRSQRASERVLCCCTLVSETRIAGVGLLQREIRNSVKEMLQAFGTRRYIANLGHGVMKDTDPEHLAEFINSVHEHSESLNATY